MTILHLVRATWRVGLIALLPQSAIAQQVGIDARSTTQTGETATQTASPPAPTWVATLSAGVLARDGDAAQPFVVGGVSRRIGRGYVRTSATTFRSVVRQIDAVLPSTYTIGSIGAGGTFGNWFVDGYVSLGHQRYGGVTTQLGTRPSPVASGSAVYGASLNGGRFVALTRRLYLTPSVAVQYSANRSLRSALGADGPFDYETRETAWTGSATVRLDRFFGQASQHIVGISLSQVQTSNGAVVLTAGSGASGTSTDTADGWYVGGASASFRLASRLWIDSAVTTTAAARSGNYQVVTVGLRKGF